MHIQTQIQLGRFDERLKSLETNVKEGFKEISDNLLGRVNELTMSKLGASDFVTFRNDYVRNWDEQKTINSDKEVRIRFLERYVWVGITIVGVLEPVLIAIFIKYVTK